MTTKTGLHYLILRIARGDKSAYEEFEMMTRTPLTKSVTRDFGSNFSEEDVQEIVSHSILNMYLHAGGYRGDNGDGSAWVWVYHIARNQALKWLRTKKREVHLPDGDDRGSDSEEDQISKMMILYNPDLDTGRVEDQVEESLLIEKMIEIIRTLNPREKLILYLYYVKGWSFNQIAATIQVTPPRITQIMQSILQKCRRQLAIVTFDSL